MNEELKEICNKCEKNIHCQGKGCAWRSLSNEYCDEVKNVNKLINNLQQENQQLKEKVEYLKQKSENKDRWCQLIADIGYDYDGYRKAEHLMKLIDELVTYALYCRDGYDYLEWKKEGSDNNE